MAVRTFIYPTVSVGAPVGGATEAKQDVQITLATSANTKLDTVITNTTGLATEVTLDLLETKVPSQGQALMAASLPVVIASNQSAIPTTVASLPLPTGAATEATLAAINTKLPAQGQAAMAASSPVVIASNQSAIPVSGPLTDTELRASAVPISAASLPLPTGAATEVSLAKLTLAQASSSTGQQGPLVQAACLTSPPVYGNGATYPLTVDGASFLRTVDKATVAQASATAGQSGILIQATARTSAPSYLDTQTNPITQTLAGALRVDNSSIAGTATATGNGVVSAGVQRVAIASDNSVINVKSSGRVSANAPSRNDYSSVNVTTGAFVQLVASTTSAVTKLSIFDSSGQTLQFATGAAASETVLFNIFPGGNGDVEINITAGTRISIRALSATASVGEININYFT